MLHAFRTNDLHYIPPTTLQANPAGAPKGTLSKVYFRKNIDDLQGQYKDAQELGDAAAEEWVKGLPSAGKLQSADTARWERWEALHPPGSDLAKVLREYFRPCSSVPLVEEVQPKHVPHSGGSLPAPPTSCKSFTTDAFLYAFAIIYCTPYIIISKELLHRQRYFSISHMFEPFRTTKSHT